MKKQASHMVKWATDCLTSKCYLVNQWEVIAETPWSYVIKFSTSLGNIFLKQAPPSIAIEPKIIQTFKEELHANVPHIIAINDEHHCFLMKDAGQTLRQFLKIHTQPNLLFQAIKAFTEMQRSAEKHIPSFLALGVPDWRLDKIPHLYDELIHQTDFLQSDGITDEELKILKNLKHTVLSQCESLSKYSIPETFVQPDFNTNNMLIDPTTHKMTLIDLGEIAITHPFFSLHNFLYQATVYHDVKKQDKMYQQLRDAYLAMWLGSLSENELLEAYSLSQKLWLVYGALATYRLVKDIDLKAFRAYYANCANPLVGDLKRYIDCNQI
jgi:hypothetical protein